MEIGIEKVGDRKRKGGRKGEKKWEIGRKKVEGKCTNERKSICSLNN